MDSQADPVPPPGPPRSLVVERRRVRRPLGRMFWLTSFIVVAGLVVGTSYLARTNVEKALRGAATAHLADAGVKGVSVKVEGLNLRAKVPTGRDTGLVEDELATVPGVGTVTTVEVYRSKAEQRACSTLQGNLSRATKNQRIPFVGTTARLTPEGASMLRQVAVLLKGCRSATVIVGGHSDSHTDGFSTLSLVRARVMTGVLKKAGIDSSRLVPRGYGDEFPISEGDSAEDQQRNQRGSVAVQAN